MEFNIPQSLKSEHEELHSELVKATKAGGSIGDFARAVAKLLHPHFEKEEEIIFIRQTCSWDEYSKQSIFSIGWQIHTSADGPEKDC